MWISQPGGHRLLSRDSRTEAGLTGQLEPPENPSTLQALLELTEGAWCPRGTVPVPLDQISTQSPVRLYPHASRGLCTLPGTKPIPQYLEEKACCLQTDSCSFNLPGLHLEAASLAQGRNPALHLLVLSHGPSPWAPSLVPTHPYSQAPMPAGPYVFSPRTPGSGCERWIHMYKQRGQRLSQ